MQNLAATPANLTKVGTKLGFDTSAPGYDPTWVVPKVSTANGLTAPTTANIAVLFVDPETGTHLSASSDMPLPGMQPIPGFGSVTQRTRQATQALGQAGLRLNGR
jgi:hypothetical protein